MMSFDRIFSITSSMIIRRRSFGYRSNSCTMFSRRVRLRISWLIADRRSSSLVVTVDRTRFSGIRCGTISSSADDR